MDAAGMAGAPMAPPDVSPPPYDNPSAGVPIAIVIAIGFMVTSLILASYYFLVVRCWLRGTGGGGAGAGLLHRSRRESAAERVAAVFFTDYEADLGGGLDPDVVAALPVVKYRRSAGGKSASASAQECAVCLSEFVRDERLKLLPSCSHAFHIDCIDTWLHHNVSCPLCRTVVTGGAIGLVVRDDQYDASSRDLAAAERRIDAAARMGHGISSCRFPKTGAEQEPIRRSFSMDCFLGDLGRKPPPPPPKDPAGSEAGPSHPDVAGSSNIVGTAGAGETSGRFRRLLSSFGLGRSSRSTVLPIHLDP